MSANAKIAQDNRIQSVDGREVDALVPEELDKLQLAEHASNVAGSTADQHTVDAAPKDLNGLVQGFVEWQRDEALFSADRLDITQRNGLSLGRLASNLVVQGDLALVGVGSADNDEEVRVEIVEVEGGYSVSRLAALADENDVGGVVLDQSLTDLSYKFLKNRSNHDIRGHTMEASSTVESRLAHLTSS